MYAVSLAMQEDEQPEATAEELGEAIVNYLAGCDVTACIATAMCMRKPQHALQLKTSHCSGCPADTASKPECKLAIEASSLRVMLQLAPHPQLAGRQPGGEPNLRRAVKLLEAAAGALLLRRIERGGEP